MAFSLEYKQKMYDTRKKYIASVKVKSGCKDCGVWGPDTLLTFDHIHGDKLFSIGSRWDVSKLKLEEEIAKCEVVCFNCHAIRTTKRLKESSPPFIPFPKISRLKRDVIISEKLDGTNGMVWVDGDGDVWAGSRNRWLTTEQDNYGFARWVEDNAGDFRDIGEGLYAGEWWGAGIQRNYGLTGNDKRFSLFNSDRWSDPAVRPACCHVVPVLYRGLFNTGDTEFEIQKLRANGSVAVPGFMKPEGIVVYHTSNGQLFKQTCEGDEAGKSQESHVRAAPKVKIVRDKSKGGRRKEQLVLTGGVDRRAKK